MLPSDPATRRSSQLQTAIFGPYGIRAGWRVLIFIGLLAALFTASTPLQRLLFRRLGQDFNPANVSLGETFAFAIVLLATAIMGKFEHRRIADYGLPVRGFLGENFWKGASWGFIMLSVIIGMMAATHAYSPGGFALSAPAAVKFGLLWALAFLMVGFFEEFTFRGYIQYTLTWGAGFWPAAYVTCFIFALAHRGNPGENWIGVVEIVLIALFLCLALRRTGNLWFAIGWHMAFDWGESFFYSTRNSGIHATGHMLNATLQGPKWLSGGTVGPEATIFDLIVTVVGIVLLAKLYPEAKYPTSLPASITPAPPATLNISPPDLLTPGDPQIP
jgi:membrane protease YdiL (CAAX protease family)